MTCHLSSTTFWSHFSLMSIFATECGRSAYLVSPCSSAPFRWGRRSCLGLRTGVSPHFSMNSMREILALRGGYERGRVPLPSPMPPESGAPPHNTHPSMVPPRHPRRPSPLFFVLAHTVSRSFFHTHASSSRSLFLIAYQFLFRESSYHEYHCTTKILSNTGLSNYRDHQWSLVIR